MSEGDELRINASLDGALAEALRRVEQRLDNVERALESAGRAGDRAGDQIEGGADKAADALGRTGRAAEGAAEALDDVDTAAGKAGDELGSAGRKAQSAAAGFAAARKASAEAAEALERTKREAEQAARALDDAGDEAAQAGIQAAASSTGWEKLWRAIDRNERVTRRYAAAQDAMRWDAWTARAERFRGGMGKLLNLPYDKASKKLDKLSKSFGGFTRIMKVGKIAAIATAVWALLGAVSALGAGAIGAIGGLLSLVPAIAAIGPVAVAAAAAMIAFKVAAEPLKDELDQLKSRFAGVGNAIANGGLRSALNYLDKRIGKLAENVESGMAIIGKALGKSVRVVADYASSYETLKDLGTVWVGLGRIVERFGEIAVAVFDTFMNVIRAAMPAAIDLTDMIADGTDAMATWMQQMTDSGKATDFITRAYDRMRYAVGILVDLVIGLYHVFRIGAEESAWMATSIHDAAQKFKEFTQSAEGQNKIRAWFESAMPAIREAGLLIRDLTFGLGHMSTNVDLAPLLNQIRTQLLPALLLLAEKVTGNLAPGLVDLATKLATLFSKLDLSALTILLDGLNDLLDSIIWLIDNVPGANWVLSTLLTLFLLIGPAAKIASLAMKPFKILADMGKWIATAVKGGEGLTTMQRLFSTIWGWGSKLVGLLRGPLVAVISRIGPLITAAFASGPIGWIILAIAAVVGAFIWAYNNVEWFRDGVNAALSAVGDFFVWLWEKARDAFGAIGSWIKEQWENWIKPTLDAIWMVLKFIGAIIFVILVAPFVIAWNIISDAVVDTWNQRIKPTLNFFGEIFSWLWNNAIKPALDWIQQRWTDLGNAIQWVYDNAIRPAIQFFADILTWLNANVVVPVVGWIVDRWNDLGTAFRWVYDTILKPLFDAFGAVINWLWVNAVQPVLGWIEDRWHDMGTALDWVRANVIDPAFDAVGAGLNWVRDRFNDAVKVIGDIWNGLRSRLAVPINFVIDKVWNNGILKVWNWVAEKIGLPVGQPLGLIPEYAAGGAIRGPGTGTSDSIPAMVSNGEHVWTAEEVRRAGGHDRVMALRRMAKAGALPYYASGGPVTPQEMLATVAGSIPGTRLSSGYRPGDPGYHGRNRAADLVGPNMRNIDSFIGTKFPGSSELIHTPGPYNIKNGSPFTYSAAVRADHYDHVHWANNGSDGSGGGVLGWIMGAAWDWAKPILDGIIDPIINGIPFHGPPQFLDIPKRMASTAKDGLWGWIERKINEWGGGGGGEFSGGAGSPEVMAALQAAAARRGWGAGGQWNALLNLVRGESGFNPNAQNPTSTAYGLFQFLNSTWGTVGGSKTSNPALQSEYGMRYIASKYGTPANAYGMWSSRSPHWYDEGGMLPPGLSMVMNGTGSPEPVFTSSQWDMLDPTQYIEAMQSTPPSLAARAASAREDELAYAVRDLAGALAERPPALSVSGDETKRATLAALREYGREQELKNRYKYGGK